VNSLLSAEQTLDLLKKLKQMVADFTARAAKLGEDLRLKLARDRQRRELALQEQSKQSAADRAQAEAAFQALRSAVQNRYQQRKARITKAGQAARAQGIQRVEDATGARKYALQKAMLQAERDRESGLTNAAKRVTDLKGSFATEQEALAQLERAAQKAFGGHRKFLRRFFAAYEKAEPPPTDDEERLVAEIHDLLAKTRENIARFRKPWVLRMFKYAALWIVLALVLVGLAPLLRNSGYISLSNQQAAAAVGGGLVLLLLFRSLAQRRAAPLARTISESLAKVRRWHDAGLENLEAHHQSELARLQSDYEGTGVRVDQDLKQALAKAGQMRVSSRMSTDEKAVRAAARWEELHRVRLGRLERGHQDALTRLAQESEQKAQAELQGSEEATRKLEADDQEQWHALEADWQKQISAIYHAMEASREAAEKLFPTWTDPAWANWTPPAQFAHAAQFAQLQVDVDKLCEPGATDHKLVLPGPARFAAPLCLIYPDQGSVLFETANAGHDQAIAALNNVVLRLLASSPPGRLRFTVIDPVGLGQNFAGVMHMADYEEQIINSRIWTQSGQIEQRLADLNEHMEKVIQMYLRNEYQTIAQYNEQAGVIAEKYHFLVIADFPSSFTETAAKRLMSIAASGARCGVYVLIHWDQRQPIPAEFIPDELRKRCFCLTHKGGRFLPANPPGSGVELVLDDPPAPEFALEFIHRVGRSSRDSSRVEVPFSHVAPAPEEVWTEDTTTELRVPIGRTGATKLQYLAIGKGTRQHGLIAGKTGSGKSTLFHVIITNLALWCNPEQVEFYLVDFKKGVEFKCYATRRLPQARVVAIESDREFGLSVLQRLDDELRRRGDLFRKLGVQDVPGYKRAGGTEPVPRSLLMVDEFQEFFVEDDKIAQTASLLLDRLVRQGRAFGIHVLLGSQTLGGAYTVARTTLGQMVIRIALQCNEADAYLIMDDNNPAPRLLSRPGEGIYNDTAGTVEGNSPFQVVWLPEDVRDEYLQRVRDRADQQLGAYPGPIVFEGNAPADVRENLVLQALLEGQVTAPALAPRLWLGAPNSIKGPTEAIFHRQSGNNLLVVGQREEAALAIVSLGLIALAAQFPLGAAEFILCDISPPGSPEREFLNRVLSTIPHRITQPKPNDLPELMNRLLAEMKRRSEEADAAQAPATFLFIHDLPKFNRLRYEEDFSFSSSDAEGGGQVNPAAALNTLVCEGTRLGFHVVATCDTYNNVNRFLSRKAFSEFEMRVLFQMSANDSAGLIDNPKASLLGLHRALYYNAQQGHLETFRPYALPGNEWLDSAARNLARQLKLELSAGQRP
jgi:DNA segregation ATPase FtsK/SpoIIIE, S-DNA-T family